MVGDGGGGDIYCFFKKNLGETGGSFSLYLFLFFPLDFFPFPLGLLFFHWVFELLEGVERQKRMGGGLAYCFAGDMVSDMTWDIN